MIKELPEFVNLSASYNEKPYSDYMKKMCRVRDEEVSNGNQEASVMNMLLISLKKINMVRVDVLKWLSEHYYSEWEIVKNLLYFVSKGAKIQWFQLFESLLEKWPDNKQYVHLIYCECQKAFEAGISIDDVSLWVESTRTPYEFSLMLESYQEEDINGKSSLSAIMAESDGSDGRENSILEDIERKELMENLAFYKEQCRAQQSEIESLNRYKIEQELRMLCEKEEKQELDYAIQIEQQKEMIIGLEQENLLLKTEIDEIQEMADLEIATLQEKLDFTEAELEKISSQKCSNSTVQESKTIEKGVFYRKDSFFSNMILKIHQRRFEKFSEIRQRECILKYVIKNNAGDLEYIKLVKTLLENKNIGFSFVYKMVKLSASKEELKSLLLLLDDTKLVVNEKKFQVNNGEKNNQKIDNASKKEEKETERIKESMMSEDSMLADEEEYDDEDEEEYE